MALDVVVMHINSETFDRIKSFYSDSQLENSNEYVLFFAKTSGCSITVYTSLTVVFQGKNAFDEASIFGYKDDKEWLYSNTHAGSDEVGTGDYFGPIVVVASYITKDDIHTLNALGINDSKKISDNYIKDIGPKLLKEFKHSLLVLDNKTYNKLIKQGWNMNSLKASLHNQALYLLSKKVPSIPYFVVDQFTPKDNYFRYLKNEKHIITNIEFTTKGESLSPAVALSSMMARYVFLVKMEEMSKELGSAIPLGAGTGVDDYIADFIRKHGIDKLSDYAKVNFKNTEKVLDKLSDKLV